MMKALKILGLVFVVICALSINIKNKTIFTYVYDVISPATKIAQSGVVAAATYSADVVREFSRKLIDNSNPKFDSVKSKLSGLKRTGKIGEPAEDIAPQEKAELDELIKSH